MKIRLAQKSDIIALESLCDEVAIFPSEMLEEMMQPYFTDGEAMEIWLVCLKDEKPIGFCYGIQEIMADGVWNMLALAVSLAYQREGVGALLVKAFEDMLMKREQRLLIVDTSSEEEYAPARLFYKKNGYAEEARIRDFWSRGADKITFKKSLKI